MSEKLFSVAKTELEANETAARELYESARRDFEAVALDEFERNGGCRFCRGEGGDMVGYHDGDSVWERCRQCGGKYWVLHDDGWCQACVLERQAKCRHIMETLKQDEAIATYR